MRKVEITLEDGRPKDIVIDENASLELDAFFLVTHGKQVDAGHFLVFGNSDKVGKMLYNFYLHCIREDAGDMGHVMEMVASDILAVAQLARRQKLDRGIIAELSGKVNYSH
ncbi:MAG: hypothetical protein IH577_03770 [Deltaproteobacteria bacterium]|nr:hypothetical protein [Deltaproteobacteria bacterium]